MRLYLVRHPHTEIAPGVCYGSTDVAVAADQIEHAVATLLPQLPVGAPVFASPLQRCWRLAERLADALGSAPVVRDARLSEVDFGAWEMRAWEDIARHEVDAWAADVAGYRPGGGESIVQAAGRVADFLNHLLEQGQPNALVVCHAGTIRLLQACRFASTPQEIALLAADSPNSIAYGSLTVLEDWPTLP